MTEPSGSRPDLRRQLQETLTRDVSAFRTDVTRLAERYTIPTADRAETAPAVLSDRLPAVVTDHVSTAREQRLCWKAWVLDEAPLGVALTGPAYHDNPVVYASQTLRAITGYTLPELVGENLRRLQGPATAREPVEDLRASLRAWNPTTVELTNYRRDGTPFRNRLSIVPVPAPDGTVDHWFGVQAPVDADDSTE